MSITYYYAPMSTAVRTTWAVEELGVPCERVKLDIQKKDTKTELPKRTPTGQSRALVVDGMPIFESTAILVYLGETYGVDGPLSAAGPQARARPQVDRLGERRLLRSGQPLDA